MISEDGYIFTDNHVIEGADAISIEFFSGEENSRTPRLGFGCAPPVDGDRPVGAATCRQGTGGAGAEWAEALGGGGPVLLRWPAAAFGDIAMSSSAALD